MDKDTKKGVWDILIKAAVPISVMTAGAIITHEVRISRIESNQFTGKMGSDLRNDMKEWVTSQFPPPWLKESMIEIKQSLRDIEARIRSLESRK